MAQNTSGGGSNYRRLVPKKIMDSRGFATTRYVKEDDGGSNNSAALSSQPAVSGSAPVRPDIDWNAASVERAKSAVKQVEGGLSDPDKLWNNFDFYTGLLESKHSNLAVDSIRRNEAPRHFKNAWLFKHAPAGTVIRDIAEVGGDEGYAAYARALGDLTKAYNEAIEKQRTKKPEPEPEIVSASNPDDFQKQFPGFAIYAAEPVVAPEPSFAQQVKDAIADRDYTAPFEDKFDDIAESIGSRSENVVETVMAGMEGFSDRHASEIPESAGGTVTPWKDIINPFKGWGKKK